MQTVAEKKREYHPSRTIAHLTQLTFTEEDDIQPVPSPSGAFLAFTSSRTGNRDIFMMDLKGKKIVVSQKTFVEAMDSDPA